MGLEGFGFTEVSNAARALVLGFGALGEDMPTWLDLGGISGPGWVRMESQASWEAQLCSLFQTQPVTEPGLT